MALFQFTALGHRGKSFKGVVNADSLTEAKDSLKEQNIIVIGVNSYQSDKKLVLSKNEVLDFTRDLHQLLKASLPLYECLKAIADKGMESKNHTVYVDICDMVKQGKLLSYGLKQYSSSFSNVYVAMVESAEESGALASVFQELLRTLNQENKLRKQLSSAMIYPAFLGCFCLIVIIGLFTFMIPSMKELFEGRKLHPFTETVLAISDWITAYKFIIFPTFFAAIVGVVLYFKSYQGKRVWQRVILKLPLIGNMVTQSIMLKFSRTFSVLLTSGVPIVRAIEMASKVMDHYQFEAVILKAKDKIIEGKKLSAELSKSKLIPTLVVKMIATAEATATMDTMLASIAEIYEADLDKNLAQLSSLIQPIMILILGIIVGGVLLAVLLPLTDVSSFLT
ncbi:MAG: type II secretion system F family protein [Rhabdochlamydiaceae bacterium]|nr:type II secretion system F family protein [Candidatus Amphrikana amoebophyrae]